MFTVNLICTIYKLRIFYVVAPQLQRRARVGSSTKSVASMARTKGMLPRSVSIRFHHSGKEACPRQRIPLFESSLTLLLTAIRYRLALRYRGSSMLWLQHKVDNTVRLVPCTDKKEVLEIDLLFNQRTGITLRSMRLLYTALLGPSILIVMVESHCASNLLHYHIHTHIAPPKALPSSPALPASVRYGC
jgi:hypothetical protein